MADPSYTLLSSLTAVRRLARWRRRGA